VAQHIRRFAHNTGTCGSGTPTLATQAFEAVRTLIGTLTKSEKKYLGPRKVTAEADILGTTNMARET